MKEIKTIKDLDAEINIHGSKSYTQRALITAALSKGRSKLINAQICDDSKYMIQALKEFGADIGLKNQTLFVYGVDGKVRTPKKEVFIGNAGTAMRFLTTLSTLVKGEVVINGDEQIKKRPQKDLISTLQQQGIDVESKNGYAPIKIKSYGLRGGIIRLKGDVSSQYLSSLLLSCPYAKNPMRIEMITQLASKPYVDMTLDVIKRFGGEIIHENYKNFFVNNEKRYKARGYIIEGDYSNASYFFAAAAITGGKIRVKGLNPCSLQGDSKFLEVLQKMGCKIKKRKEYIEVIGGELKGINVDLNDCPDIVQTLAVTAAFAKGKTRITGVNNLRFKETNRIKALTKELKKIGVKSEAQKDKITIIPNELKGCKIETYNDHRMAMGFAIAGLKIPGIKIENPGCVNKSFPNFFQTMELLR